MDTETACRILSDGGFEIVLKRRLPNGKGDQIKTVSGEVINVYDTGTCVVQGLYNEALVGLFGKRKKLTQPNRAGLNFEKNFAAPF